MKNLLRERRIAAGYKNVRGLAKALNICAGTYWNWENGYGATTYAPRSALTAKKVCDALGISDAALKEAISNNYQAKLAGKMEKAPRATGYAYKRHNKATVLSNWRIKEQIASRDVAEMLGVSQRTYLSWEDGTKKPTGDDLKNLIDLTGLSMHQIASMYVDDEPEVIASPVTPEEFSTINNKEVITERDENGKPVAGRYIFKDSDGHAKLTREGERKVAEYTAKLRSQLTAASIAKDLSEQEALNEPHDFRDEVIDEVLEKMYGQMDYKKYVCLIGLLGR